ncbi:MarR family winged helix-turn-helix transcriptional regulator [Georgenia sp. SYP-B2076]|uniref:MarR family winged helix-turn-helix transcriptional regulator n=1 Tax=Georgenia sp. SYP-B2076 TaxID=2495881 RepID=UPI0013E03BDB|nr:MarR family transcriptional regulator [Georgenia sp. SYP-B2076]
METIGGRAAAAEDGAGEGSSETEDGLQAAFAAMLRWASRASVRTRLWGGDGTELTPTDAWLVEALAGHGPMRVSTLAAWQGVDKSTVTPQVRRLERAGLVDRVPDPQDGRAALLSLSPRGREVRDRVRTSGTEVLAEQLASWSAADRRTFTELLTRFAAGLAGGPPAGRRDPA